ncbi:hypothetical protein A5821_001100 [Enterococcus sp. 7F3_DIV0205]|uniref:Uncharacterized protein n=1 Tax=Candidatus Enterococcus palustris TaxID=1834189 RepID=A0AAQ3WCT5_9ENTE|nr:hypothetical protein [Enterococcus sp. 7F3_DIV0205]OTN85497.1 hypothetical protein A5821_001443 [Enterococcus sp. 7F3_DIV0205]
MTLFLHPVKIKRILFGYWLAVPLLFGCYSLILATVKQISLITIFTSIPSLALTSIVVLLMIFQLFGLYIVGDLCEYRNSLLGFYLKFNMVQQLLTLNIPGFLFCLFFYRSLLVGKEKAELSKQMKWTAFSLMGFISIITILVVLIRLSL